MAQMSTRRFVPSSAASFSSACRCACPIAKCTVEVRNVRSCGRNRSVGKMQHGTRPAHHLLPIRPHLVAHRPMENVRYAVLGKHGVVHFHGAQQPGGRQGRCRRIVAAHGCNAKGAAAPAGTAVHDSEVVQKDAERPFVDGNVRRGEHKDIREVVGKPAPQAAG